MMTSKKTNPAANRLMISAGILLMSLLGLSLVSYKTHKMGDEIWSQLGLSKQDANISIGNSFLEGYLYYYEARNAKNIITGSMPAIVKELGAYAKQYVNSEAFKKEYQQKRESSKPEPPVKAKTIDELRTEHKENLQKSIKDLEPMLKSDNPELKKIGKESLDYLQKQLKEISDPNNQLMKLMADGEKLNFETRTEQYKTDLETWEKEMPANQMFLVKNRLQQFLSATSDVDFNAELKEKNGKKRFVNPEYESKDSEWKLAYRAGKDASETARALAQQWLKEIN